MKKMNNKGFAITALIYGLAIMAFLLIAIIMSTLSSMRKNVNELSKDVEQELLNLSKSSVEYVDVGDDVDEAKTYIYSTPSRGYYRIEVWSPIIKNAAGTKKYRTYSTGVIKLNERENLRINFLKKTTKIYNGAFSLYDDSCKDGFNLICANTNETISEAGTSTLGGLNHDSRYNLFNMYLTTGSYYVNIWPKYRLLDPFIIKSDVIGPIDNMEKGKVIIQKVSSDDTYEGNNRLKNKYINIKLTGQIDDLYFSKNDPDNNTCTVYYGTDTNSSYGENVVYCEKLTNSNNPIPPMIKMYSSTPGGSCYYRRFDSSETNVEYDYQLRGLESDNPSLYNITGLTIACPKKYQTQNIGLTIYQTDSNVPENFASSYQQLYNGKYINNNKSGIQLSTYQPSLMVDKPKSGNFYILTFDGLNAVTVDPIVNVIVLKNLYGLPSQKWHIETIGNYNLNSKEVTDTDYNPSNSIDRIYKIESLSNFRAVDIRDDENKINNEISTQYTFNPLSLNSPQVWRLIKNEDNTYSFKTIINNSDDKIGYIGYEQKPASENYEFKIIKANNDGTLPNNAKFILYSYDNSLDKN